MTEQRPKGASISSWGGSPTSFFNSKYLFNSSSGDLVLLMSVVPPNVFKFTFHIGVNVSELLLQVNVTVPLSGTTYSPSVSVGAAFPDRASLRVAEKGQTCI